MVDVITVVDLPPTKPPSIILSRTSSSPGGGLATAGLITNQHHLPNLIIQQQTTNGPPPPPMTSVESAAVVALQKSQYERIRADLTDLMHQVEVMKSRNRAFGDLERSIDKLNATAQELRVNVSELFELYETEYDSNLRLQQSFNELLVAVQKTSTVENSTTNTTQNNDDDDNRKQHGK